MATKLPPEMCQECGKTISRRAIANVFEERIVCTACWRRLLSEKQAREYVPPPATEKQIRYARELGLSFPADITSQQMSDLIQDRVNPVASAQLIGEAQGFGLPTPPGVRTQELEDRLGERKTLVSWVYSVCRHLLRAKWVYHRDSGLDFAPVLWIASRLEADEALLESVHEQDEGCDDDLDDWRYEHQDEPEPGPWYFFGREGPSTRCKAYRATVEMVRDRLGIAPAP